MMTLAEIAEFLSAELVPAPGQEDSGATPIQMLAPIEHAVPGTVTFLANDKYLPQLAGCEASAVICPPAMKDEARKTALLLHDNPYLAFALLAQKWFKEPDNWKGVSERAFVDASATVGESVTIEPFVSIAEGATIGERVTIRAGASVGRGAVVGDDTVIHQNVTVQDRCKVGARCIVHPGAVIGSDGFGFATDMKAMKHEKIPQMGVVVVEDDVEIGANTTIDRAVLGETRIGAGTKIDNLVQIAHNVQVGRGCFLVSQCGVSGSTKLGNFVTLAGQVGVVGHITVGDGAQIGAQSGVNREVPAGAKLLGSPAINGKEMLRVMATWPKLPEMRRRLRKLEKAVEKDES